MPLKLSISALAWEQDKDFLIFQTLNKLNIKYVELVPSRIGKDILKYKDVFKKLSITPVAFQSLLHNTQNLALFETAAQREKLFDHLKSLFSLAQELNVKRLIFGSPKNRAYDPQKLSSPQAWEMAQEFFLKVSECAILHHTYLCMEPNPQIYGTNFLNTTNETAKFVKDVNHSGLRLNLDLGALTINQESLSELWPSIHPLIGHIHWSAPDLAPINQHPTNALLTLNTLLKTTTHDDGLVSIEMKSQTSKDSQLFIEETVAFAKSLRIFCDQ